MENIVNTQPLDSSFVLTPSYFPIGSYNNVILFDTDNMYEDTENTFLSWILPRTCWIIGRKIRNNFKYLGSWLFISLRETLPLVHKGPRLQMHQQAETGEIVILKGNDLPCTAWKLAEVRVH